MAKNLTRNGKSLIPVGFRYMYVIMLPKRDEKGRKSSLLSRFEFVQYTKMVRSDLLQ